MLIIVRTTSDGVQSSAVVCYCAFVITSHRHIVIIIVTGDKHRHRCCSRRGRRKNEKTRTKEKTVCLLGNYTTATIFSRTHIVPILTTDLQRLDDGLANSLTVYIINRNKHFHTFFPSICLIIIPRVEIKLELPWKTCELQFPSTRTYYIQVFFYLHNIIIAIYF